MLIYLCIIIVILIALHCLIHYNAKAKVFNKIPGPRVLPVVGNALDFFSTQGILYFLLNLYYIFYNFYFWSMRVNNLNEFSNSN